MPGIVGLITRMPREQAMRELQRMIGSMRHETFYVEGTWADEALGIYVGWVERACSSGRNVPLQSESGDNVLVFSGEEFPEPGVAEDLKRRGHVLTSADEYLVHLAEEDAHFPAGLNGQFHGLLVDRRQRKLTLFNDRFSLHRLYFHQAKDAFYFAAEAKSILTLRPELRKVDWRGMAE